jgi:hypothetical protein
LLLAFLGQRRLGLLGLGHEVLHHAEHHEYEQEGQKHSLVCARLVLRIAIFSQ